MRKKFGISKLEKSPGIPSRVTNQIIDLITKGILKPGDKLPSEHEMTNLFGISRISLREGLKVLEARGYIESHERRGKFVKSMFDDLRTPMIDHLSVSQESMWELIYVWRILDAEAAALAANNATLEQVKQIKQLFKEARKIGLSKIIIAPKGIIIYTHFFELLANTTGNTVFVHLSKTMTDILHEYFPIVRERLSTISGISKNIVTQLRKISDAIEKQKSELARIATIDHINYIEKSLKIVLEEI
ncbi:transcriptional regulator, gntr family [hydrocarbon metagenome]|uniref:Transcriptional regulator, gntr family n=1 Tax=hydrocarbon metagenome TaxID=938273 RepID=A0A0W8FN58_9ZZZZ